MSRLKYNIARPIDPGSNGAYAYSYNSGIMAAALAGDAEVFQFQWGASKICVIQHIFVQAAVSTTYFAAGVPFRLSLYRVSGWTVAGSGGNRLTPAALGKKNSAFASTSLAANASGISSTAGLTAGTKTIEATPLHTLAAGAPITSSLSGQIFSPNTEILPACQGDGDYPLVLQPQAANFEGFVITAPEVPGTGTWKLNVCVHYVELTQFP